MRTHILLSLLSVALLSSGWIGLTGLPLLGALVPLLWISGEADRSRRAFWGTAGWVALTFGLWSAITTWWIWHAAPIGAILSVIITALLMGGAFMLYHFVSKRTPAVLARVLLVSAWIAAEYLYTVGEVSFPWLTLGNGFANDPAFVQWYEFTGVFGGSLWALVCNLLIYSALKKPCGLRKWLAPVLAVGIPAVVSSAMYLVQGSKLQDGSASVQVSVVQPNIDPYGAKFAVTQAEQTGLMLRLARLAPQGVDYIVLPETAIDDHLWEEYMAQAPAVTMFRETARTHYPETQFIVGATTFRRYHSPAASSPTARQSKGSDFWYDVYNSAFSVDTTGHVQIHHKSKLVVGVEKMPYYSVLRHLEFLIVDLGGIAGQLGQDSVRRVFHHPVSGVRSGTGICFESVYGAYLSEFVQNGAQILFIITNDGWWEKTMGHRNHFSFARLRAIEMRRSIARSANTGISGFINLRGNVIEKLAWQERGTITCTLTLNDRITFYARYGDYIGRLACYLFLLCLLFALSCFSRFRAVVPFALSRLRAFL